MQKLNYIKEFDGLRALAILFVFFYHLEIFFLKNGFLGVDIFFVLSGYLITRSISFAISNNDFSFSEFYIRRINRLFPPLFLMILAVTVVGNFILPSPSIQSAGGAGLHALFGISNLFFWTESGYFDSSSALKPLLHTWSLGVEEQFYLFWPLIVYFSLKKNLLSISLVFLFTLSILLTYIFEAQHSLTFYLTPFRVFEFCFGAFI